MNAQLEAILIDVTQEDIANAQRWNAARCPVALAIRRATGRMAYVGGKACPGVVFWDPINERETHQPLPPAVNKFVYMFDNLEEVEPITFVLTLNLPN